MATVGDGLHWEVRQQEAALHKEPRYFEGSRHHCVCTKRAF